ncbi:peptidylprolyl isomerase [Niveibacterium umoris]|uniref:Peptidyl-prolyl cis-trans isomerase n=2 Tax=Niveibacterium umoris TaxID=1193620 RepID=A0A840BG04_9RHOO|nr:peptidylprolyl isomerase [Niveibacterium umoris]MBB4011124.1 peptidyl-prolyl cis-trans isomerase A (cyclophilin A) [Niveibacterium umoris]
MSLLAACGGGSSDSGSVTPTPPASNCSDAGVAASNASAFPTVCMLTSRGEMVFELYPASAPATVSNFLKYVSAGFYSDTAIHRVVPSFVFQGGGYTRELKAKDALYGPITLESNNGLSNLRGTIAMARTSDPNSATSQFFVNTVDNLMLNYDPNVAGANGYAVFGKVISGLPVVDAIGRSATNAVEQPTPGITVYWVKQLK